MEDIKYYKDYQSVVDLDSKKQLTWRGKRGDLTEKYSWAIPNEEVITFLKNESQEEQTIEIGAGNGYWAYEIQRRGGQIVPIDISSPEKTWTDVIRCSYDAINPSSANKIFLCWPPANDNMAFNCLQYLRPKTVYFAGRLNSTETGNHKFHQHLQNAFSKKEQKQLPSWRNRDVYLYKFIN